MKQNKGVNLINKVSLNDILPLKSTVFSMIHAKFAFLAFQHHVETCNAKKK